MYSCSFISVRAYPFVSAEPTGAAPSYIRMHQYSKQNYSYTPLCIECKRRIAPMLSSIKTSIPSFRRGSQEDCTHLLGGGAILGELAGLGVATLDLGVVLLSLGTSGASCCSRASPHSLKGNGGILLGLGRSSFQSLDNVRILATGSGQISEGRQLVGQSLAVIFRQGIIFC